MNTLLPTTLSLPACDLMAISHTLQCAAGPDTKNLFVKLAIQAKQEQRTDVIMLPSVENDEQTGKVIQRGLKDRVGSGVAYAGRFSDLHHLMQLSQTHPLVQARIKAVLAGTHSVVHTCPPLAETVSLLHAQDCDPGFTLCALSPETSFRDPCATAEFSYSLTRANFRLQRFGAVCGNNLTKIKEQIEAEQMLRQLSKQTGLANIIYGLLFFKANSPVQQGTWNEYSTLADQLFHELTHYADLCLFDNWVKNNIVRAQQKEPPDKLFTDSSLFFSGQYYLPTELYQMISEIRAYYVSVCVIAMSDAFKQTGKTLEDLKNETAEKVYLRLCCSGLKPMMDLHGVNKDNIWDTITEAGIIPIKL